MNRANLDEPIELGILPWTGRIDGDDEGYRKKVLLSPLDAERPDPMVRLSSTNIRHSSVYANAPLVRIYPLSADIGDSREILMRHPAILGITEQNRILKPSKRQVLIINGYRPGEVQARMWAQIYAQNFDIRSYFTQSVITRLKWGKATERIGAHVALVQDDQLRNEIGVLENTASWKAFIEAAEYFSTETERFTPQQMAMLFLTYHTNLGYGKLKLDFTAATPHGNGGAADAWLLDTNTWLPTCNGVYYDHAGSACKHDFFENPHHLAVYQEEVAKNKILRTYLAEFGITKIDRNVFEMIRRERRMQFHSARQVGATTYFKECWHSNYDNTRGGNQSEVLPGSGNSCQALLKNVRHPDTNEWTACWTNAVAHELVEKLSQ